MGSVGPFELAPAPDLERLMPLLPSLFPLFPLDEELELLPGELSATLGEGSTRDQAAVRTGSHRTGLLLECRAGRNDHSATHPGGWHRLRSRANGRSRAVGARATSSASRSHGPIPERRRGHGAASWWPVG